MTATPTSTVKLCLARRAVLTTTWALAALAGCSPPLQAGRYLVTGWSHERPVVDGVEVISPGVDLDGVIDEVEGEACTQPLDHRSPSGLLGVDNQYAATLVSWLDAALGDTTEAARASPSSRWIVELEGTFGPRAPVTVRISAAIEADGGWTSGALLGGGEGRFEDDWLTVPLGTMPLPMGEVVGDRTVDHTVLRLHLPNRALVAHAEGELGASAPIELVLSVARRFEPALERVSAERMARPDLDWDHDGVCEAVSVGVGLSLERLP